MSRPENIYVAGHNGMVGAAIVRLLSENGRGHIITRGHKELDLTEQAAVRKFFHEERVDRVILAAARVGGIHANNTYPADFIYINLMIEANVIHQAYQSGVRDLLFLGSSCIYPKFAPQPMKEEHLLTGILEPTNEPYAIAKIAGIKLCESYNRQYGTSYRSVMPTNLFGPGDNYHLENSHVLPAMLRKCHLAKLAMEKRVDAIIADERTYGEIPEDVCLAIGYQPETKRLKEGATPRVELWGTGSPRREFLHVDDMAAACLYVMDLPQSQFTENNPSFVNIGTGVDNSIQDAAAIIAELVGYRGEIAYNSAQPDGTPRKLLDVSRILALGWKPRLSFREGLKNTYDVYRGLSGCS